MVSENTVETPRAPNTRIVGFPDYPNSVKYDSNAIIHVPEIEADNLAKMMKFDGQVGGLYRILTTPIRGAKIEIEKPNNRANRETNLIREILTENYSAGGMVIPMQQVLASIMRMLVDGWSPHEIVWEIRNGMVRVYKIDYRPTKSIRVRLDSRKEVDGYTQDLGMLDITRYDGDSRKVFIPPDKIMHFVNSPEWNPVYGRSLFTQAYFHFEKKHKLYYISHLAAQISALKMRLLRSPTDDEKEIEKYVSMVSKLGFNSTVNLPTDWEFELLDTQNNFPDILPLIQHHDAQMSKSVLAQVLDVGVEGRTGSFNLSDTHFDIFIVNLELMSEYISTIFNTVLIPKLIDWNFGTGFYPKVKFLPFDRQIKQRLFTIFQEMVKSQHVNATPEFMYQMEQKVADIMGLDISYPEMEDRISVFEDILKRGEPQPANDSGNTTTSSET